MATNGTRKSSTPAASASPITKPRLISQGLFDSVLGDTNSKEKKKKTIKIKLKKQNPKQSVPGNWSNENEVTGLPKKQINSDGKTVSPILNTMSEALLTGFSTGRLFEDQPDKIMCKHCKRPILRHIAADHVKECLDKKQAKLKKKKEKKEAKDAAKKAERAGDEDDDVLSKSAKKSAIKDGDDDAKKGKKRKLDADAEKAPNAKKKKKDEPKAKLPKTKGPVDVERQCGVQLPNGGQCARSLTCKSHSMGLKRAVPGRSLPYDMLLAQYQKKNQAKQQRAAIDANAPLLDDLDTHGPVDSDEEKDAVMNAIARSRPRPLITRPLLSTRNKYQFVRMKEMLHNALGSRFTPHSAAGGLMGSMGSMGIGLGGLSTLITNGAGTGGLGGSTDGLGSTFATPLNSASLDSVNANFERRSSVVPSVSQRPSTQGSMAAPARKPSVSAQV